MKEIEFRAKGLYKDRWYYGYYVEYKKPMQHYIIDLDETVMDTQHLINEDTLGQYTGLKDINKTKIFDGDLLYYHNANHDKEDGVMEVIFEDGAFMISGDILVPLHETYCWELEVVGNIHDNPELLGEIYERNND